MSSKSEVTSADVVLVEPPAAGAELEPHAAAVAATGRATRRVRRTPAALPNERSKNARTAGIAAPIGTHAASTAMSTARRWVSGRARSPSTYRPMTSATAR